MSTNGATLFEAFLKQHDSEAWSAAITNLLPHIHEVDKNATQIWFAFYPLTLAQALQQAEDPKELAQKLLLFGKYYLKDQIDSSHYFLYGHRYWPEVKQTINELATSSKAPASLELAAQIRDIANTIAKKVGVEAGLVIGITAVGFMTLQQVGSEAFRAASGKINLSANVMKKTPEQILSSRAKDDSQGIMGLLRTIDQVWTVNFNENEEKTKFKLINSQDLATASARDKRDYRSADQRCIEGPIPVECRSAACGTCWVGVLGGAEKLADVSSRERRKLQECGYSNNDEAKPLIRLACVTPAYGAVSLVIPPWNGVFGRRLREMKEKEEAKEANY